MSYVIMFVGSESSNETPEFVCRDSEGVWAYTRDLDEAFKFDSKEAAGFFALLDTVVSLDDAAKLVTKSRGPKVVWSQTYDDAVVGVDENGAPLTASNTPADSIFSPFYLRYTELRDINTVVALSIPEAFGWRRCRVTIEVLEVEE